MKIRAVLTCDLVDSSKLNPGDRQTLSNRMKVFAEELSNQNQTEYLVYRGDSLQGLIYDPSQALRHAISLKAYIKSYKIASSKRSTEADIRISIGTGQIDYRGESLLDSDGQAFHNSGRTLDSMKKKGRTLMLTTPDKQVNTEWDVILSLLEEVVEQWTIPSAEIIWRLLKGIDDKDIQFELDISQPAVSLRKKHAGWEAIRKAINYYEDKFTIKENGDIT